MAEGTAIILLVKLVAKRAFDLGEQDVVSHRRDVVLTCACARTEAAHEDDDRAPVHERCTKAPMRASRAGKRSRLRT